MDLLSTGGVDVRNNHTPDACRAAVSPSLLCGCHSDANATILVIHNDLLSVSIDLED